MLGVVSGLLSVPASAAAGQTQAQQVSEITEACGERGQRGWLCSTVFNVTDSTRAAEIADDLSKPLRIVLILVVTYLLVRIARRLIKRTFEPLRNEQTRRRIKTIRHKTGLSLLDTGEIPTARRIQRAETISSVLRSVVSIVIWSVSVLIILSELGIDLAPLLAGAGVLGVALGFGAQSVVRDFLTGTFMVLEDQFGVGDVIDVGDASGTVEGLSLRTTRLRDVEGVVWHVPNGEIKRVANKSQQWSRAVLDVPVALETDIEHAKRVIKETADAVWREPPWSTMILGEPEVWGVEALGAQGVVIRLVVKTRPLEQWAVARELRARVKQAFDHAGIRVPPPMTTPTDGAAGAGH
jgi:moderate conductance mechanosensitive channel